MHVNRKQTEISELSQYEKNVMVGNMEIPIPFTKEINRDLFLGDDKQLSIMEEFYLTEIEQIQNNQLMVKLQNDEEIMRIQIKE